MPLGMRSPLANTRNAQYVCCGNVRTQQIVHQTTHSLARFFLEVDANYKQFKTASRLRAAAAQRLEAQRAYYEEGRITIGRFLDAVSQYAQAVAQRPSSRPPTTSQSSPSRRPKARSSPTTTSPLQKARTRGRPMSRPRISRTHTASCQFVPMGRCIVSESRDRSILTRLHRTRRRTCSRAAIRRCRPRSARSARRPRPCRPIARRARHQSSRRSPKLPPPISPTRPSVCP